jgi:hypothetical protein
MRVHTPAITSLPARVLVVADWRVDPHGVIDACRLRASRGDVAFALVVPAWLHGLDWAGDPRASRPCATRQLETLGDALQTFPATEIFLCRSRRRRHPLDLAHRLRRSSGLPLHEARLAPGGSGRERRRRGPALNGHCAAEPLRVP